MQVKLRTILAGPVLRGQPGEKITVDDQTGRELIAGGYAEAVSEPAPTPETATVEPQETATEPAPKRGRHIKR